MLMSRYKAGSIHLLISIAIGLGVIALMMFVWYPPPLFGALGGLGLMILLVGVDVVLGPLITTIIYKTGKPWLKLDLALIGLLQASALAYGMYVVALARPVLIVFAKDRFELVAAADLDSQQLSTAKFEEFKRFGWLGPKFIAAELPTDPDERSQLLLSTVAGGADIQLLPKYYRPIGSASKEIARRALSLEKLAVLNSKAKSEIEVLQREYAASKVEAGFLPLITKGADLTVIVDKAQGTPLRIVDLRPS
jgi:hypothetical protein